MKVYRYWAHVHVDEQGQPTTADLCSTGAAGWSDRSEDDARQTALQRARACAKWFREGALDRLMSRYHYLDRPVREPIVEELTVGDRRLAAITRNGYGAYVLNAANVLFADIDRRVSLSHSVRSVWNAVRGRRPEKAEQQLLDRLNTVASDHRVSLRVYRTRGGHRAVVTSRTFDPAAAESQRLLEACGSDPLYVRLCAAQQCYRARLSPKPWRTALKHVPKFRFPYRSDAEREQFEQWSATYDHACQDWAACEPVADLGPADVHEDVAPVLTLHDDLACAPGKPLA